MNNSTTLNRTLLHKLTKRVRPYREFNESFRYSFGIIEGILSPVIIFANIIVIVSIMSNPKLRHKFPYLIIVSMSLSEAITGFFSCPVRANIILSRNYSHGCAAYAFISVYEEFVQNFVSMWSMVGLNTDFLLTMFNARLPQLSELRRKLVMATFIFLPWLIMCCIVFPVAFTFYGQVHFTDKFCHIGLHRTARMVVLHMVHVLPAITLALQALVITATCAYNKRNAKPMTSDTMPPILYIVASTVLVVLVTPQQVSKLVGREKLLKLEFKGLLTLMYTVVVLGDFTAAVMPFVWFLSQDLRATCLDLYNKMPWRRSVDVFREDLSVTYKNFD